MKGLFGHFLFAQPAWLLLLLCPLFLLFLRRGKGAASAVVFPNLSVLVSLGKRARHVAGNFGIPAALLALVAAIFAMARPVWRNQTQSSITSGIDIMIAFDVSLSMEIPDFIDHGESTPRIDAAKWVVGDFISRRPDDRIGLVAFAGRPRNICPITLNHKWLRESLEDLRLNDNFNQGTVKDQGTAIGSAISAAASRLVARDAKSKVILLITDGASNSGKISPVDAAKYAKTLGIKIYTIAIGTKEGRVGNDVQLFPKSEFDLPTLKEIASVTGAEHYWAQNFASLKETFSTIDKLEKTDIQHLTVIHDRELFPGVVAFSLGAALAAVFLLALRPPL